MASKKINESDENIRDEALARRMGKLLDQAPMHAGIDCPDAEHIAAYFERALQPDEIRQCESHFASCTRCRETLAMLAAAVEVQVAAQDVAQSADFVAAPTTTADSGIRIAKPPRASRFDWRVRWLAPALGMAAVLVVWFTMRPPWGTANRDSSETLIAQVPKSDVHQIPQLPATDQFSPATPNQSFAPGSALRADRAIDNSLAKTQSPDSTSVASAKDSTKTPANLPPGPSPQPQAQLAGQTAGAIEAPAAASQSVAVTGQAPVASTSVVPGSAAPKASRAVDAVTRDEKAVAQQGAADNEPSARPAERPALNGRIFSALSLQNALGRIAVQLKPPSGTFLWRAGVGGLVERSTDAGGTWTAQTSPLQEDWLAGAAVSDRVVWLVGRKAAIAQTTDGVHWMQVTPPTLAAIAAGMPPDWIGVTATDAQNATITSADQRRYVTQDGGKTWRAQ